MQYKYGFWSTQTNTSTYAYIDVLTRISQYAWERIGLRDGRTAGAGEEEAAGLHQLQAQGVDLDVPNDMTNRVFKYEYMQEYSELYHM